jgi:hypothetical protein
MVVETMAEEEINKRLHSLFNEQDRLRALIKSTEKELRINQKEIDEFFRDHVPQKEP